MILRFEAVVDHSVGATDEQIHQKLADLCEEDYVRLHWLRQWMFETRGETPVGLNDPAFMRRICKTKADQEEIRSYANKTKRATRLRMALTF